MTSTSGTSKPFLSLLGVLLRPPDGRASAFVLTAFQDPLAILEAPGEGAAIALLDAGEIPVSAVRARLDRLFAAPVSSALYVVLVGGGEQARQALVAADRAAPDPNKLGVYHLPGGGELVHVAGRRLSLLRAARIWAMTAPPLDTADLPAIVARAAEERAEQVRFFETLQRRRPPLTIAIGSLCVLLFILSHVLGRSAQQVAIVLMGANGHDLLAVHGEWWRVLAYGFLHQNPLHLVANMMGLVSFGAFLEALVGWPRYLILYALSILAGGLASAFIGGTQVSIGASGGLWGLLGAGLALVLWPRGLVPQPVAAGMRRRLVILLGINFALSFTGNIDKWAHFGGGVVGFVFAAVGGLGQLRRGPVGASRETGEPATAVDSRPRDNVAWRLMAVAAGGAMLASVAAGLVIGKPWRAEAVLRAVQSARGAAGTE